MVQAATGGGGRTPRLRHRIVQGIDELQMNTKCAHFPAIQKSEFVPVHRSERIDASKKVHREPPPFIPFFHR